MTTYEVPRKRWPAELRTLLRDDLLNTAIAMSADAAANYEQPNSARVYGHLYSGQNDIMIGAKNGQLCHYDASSPSYARSGQIMHPSMQNQHRSQTPHGNVGMTATTANCVIAKWPLSTNPTPAESAAVSSAAAEQTTKAQIGQIF